MESVVGWHRLSCHANPTVLAARAHEAECYVSKKDEMLLWKQDDEEEEGGDCENVKRLSELFSTVEQESEEIDLQVLLEGEHAFNVDEVSEIFSKLEAAPVPLDSDDATNVDELSELFTAIEDHESTDGESDHDLSVLDEVVGAPTKTKDADLEDVTNILELSDLFTELDAQEQEQEQVSRDWIAALDVDDVSTLFSELEQLENAPERPKPAPTVDSRVYVPQFSVRIEGRPRPSVSLVLQVSGFLAGPPSLRPPVVDVPASVAGKRSTPSLPSVPRSTDPSLSKFRRACAAKRRRVNGRFVREQNSFVAITSLQQ